jgi:putative ATP-dependent endonuclease of the OLD family
MKIESLSIKNFRGIKNAELIFNGHTVIVGDNNVGKSTIIEAIDLVLGPERLSRYPVIDEHDFYAGDYIGPAENSIIIEIEALIIDLNEEQLRHFRNHLEWWDIEDKDLIDSPPVSDTDDENVKPALRVCFKGGYDKEEDDFYGNTFFCSPISDELELPKFGTRDKRLCGFIYLRTIRTGSRALSLDKGSLLDIILKLKEIRPQMWEDVLCQLRQLTVADNPELGISEILESIQSATREIVPVEWAENPKLQVSEMTRSHLRKILTVFIGTGAKNSKGEEYSAPFQHQGTGTINALVLTLLSMIAELKQNVIFAMEEPEIAIPPYTQKRIISSIIQKSAQAIFTSHSPYILEEFPPEKILVIKRESDGNLRGTSANPPVKQKFYREEFRKRLCEGLLARRVLIAEGRTEYDSFPACAKKLNLLKPDKYRNFDTLGIAVINAETDSSIAKFGEYFRNLGKEVFAVFDQQTKEDLEKIESCVDHCYEAPEKGFENVIINGISTKILKKYALNLVKLGDWPTHIRPEPDDSMTGDEIKPLMLKFLKGRKGSGDAAELLFRCKRKEMPDFIVTTIKDINRKIK